MTEQAKSSLFHEVAGYKRDPLGFVLFAFDWGHGDLKGRQPEAWQLTVLARLTERLQALPDLASPEEWGGVIRESIASGHGVGKSALFSWVILWAMSTCVDCLGVVTANTDKQLRTKTWATLNQWHRRCITRDWFVVTATAIFSADPKHERTWRVDAIPWSEHNTEGFQGLHNAGRRLLVFFDESSGIPDAVWDAAEGTLTDTRTEIIFLVAGNPTRVAGRFVETWTTRRERWGFLRVDSRSVTFSNKKQIAEWAEDWGEGSDFFRVRVRGLPPLEDDESLIPIHLLEMAAERHSESGIELVWGVDVGRQGPDPEKPSKSKKSVNDPSVLAERAGPVLQPFVVYRNRTGLDLAGSLNARVKENGAPSHLNVDATGIGADVAEYINTGDNPFTANEVWTGGAADENKRFVNIRAELCWRAIAWLKRPDADIPNDPEFMAELTSLPDFKYDTAGRMQVEKKEVLKARTGFGYHKTDSFLLTFYRPADKGPSVFCF